MVAALIGVLATQSPPGPTRIEFVPSASTAVVIVGAMLEAKFGKEYARQARPLRTRRFRGTWIVSPTMGAAKPHVIVEPYTIAIRADTGAVIFAGFVSDPSRIEREIVSIQSRSGGVPGRVLEAIETAWKAHVREGGSASCRRRESFTFGWSQIGEVVTIRFEPVPGVRCKRHRHSVDTRTWRREERRVGSDDKEPGDGRSKGQAGPSP